MSEALSLDGCTPEPLMGYLKSLGVLRLVSVKDPEARGFWANGVFHLDTTLDRDALVSFFRDEYEPTPVVAPWAGGSGFFGNDNRVAVEAIANSDSPRLRAYGEVIRMVREILERLQITTKPADEVKEKLLREYRRVLPDQFVEWLDAALVVQVAGQSFPPLLGTGGNDGRLDFTQNYMQRLTALGFHSGSLVPAAGPLLNQSLFASGTRGLIPAAVGQFDPGRAGGPNAGMGLEGVSLVNPWDFVFMLEGTLLLSGAVARRMGANQRDRAVFPFTVRAVPAGHGSGADNEEADSRGEIWLPMWSSPSSCSEIRSAFSEGRSELNGRQSRDGLDFARAIAALGVNRGFTAFTRFGFLKRSGKAYVASPLGTFQVKERRPVDLLRELDGWLERFRRACGGDEVPARFRTVRRRIEEAIFDLCLYTETDDTARWVQALLASLGAAEREMSVGSFAQKPAKGSTRPRLSPLAGLSDAWLAAADDRSPEFCLARSIAFLKFTLKTRPVREHLEPVEFNAKFRSWSWCERGGHVVWNGRDLARNFGAVAIRRLMEAEKSGESAMSFDGSIPASLADIGAFLAGVTIDDKLEDLIWGLSLVERGGDQELPRTAEPAELPRAYALLKLTLLPGKLEWFPRPGESHGLRLNRPRRKGEDAPGIAVKPESAILARLRAGDVQGACDAAVRRLRASGFSPIGGIRADGAARTIDWQAGGTSPERLLAALLFPIPDASVNQLADIVLRRPAEGTLT